MLPENTNETTAAGKSSKQQDEELNNAASKLKKTDTPEKNMKDVIDDATNDSKNEKASK